MTCDMSASILALLDTTEPTMPTIRRVDFPSIYSQVQENVKEYIVEGHLQPGDPLPSENQLAEQLGVSRTVVREAMRGLESVGVIQTRRGAGRYVGSFRMDAAMENLTYSLRLDVHDLYEILDVRKYLEAGSIEQAIANLDDDVLQRLRSLVQAMKVKVAKGEGFLQEDLDFHRQVFALTGNRVLVKLQDILWQMYQATLSDPRYTAKDQKAVQMAHEQLLNAIENRDVSTARRLLVSHIEATQELVRQAIDEHHGD